MKNALKFALVLSAGILLFAGCSDGSGSYNSSGGKSTISGLKFDLSGVSAIASVDNNGSGMRAVESEDGPIVGIEKSGATKQIILTDYASQLPPVVQFIKQTGSDGKDYLYIVFQYTSTIWNGDSSETLPQVICVSEDGSCTGVIEDNYYLSYNSENSALQFDGYGNTYYCAYSSGSSNATVIFKYDPVQQTNTRLTASVQNRSYSQLQVDSKGEWLFVTGCQYGSNVSSDFFRAIPVAEPGNYKNLSDTSYYGNWLCYEDDIYFINSGSVQKFVKQDGIYSPNNTETIFGRDHSIDAYYMLSYQSEQRYVLKELHNTWYNSKNCFLTDKSGNLNTSEIKNAFLWELGDYTISGNTDAEKLEALATKYDFRFDKFAEIKGLESLAEVAEGKKNEDAFEAVLSSESHKQLLGKLFNTYYYSSKEAISRYGPDDSISRNYHYNFLADITYLKDTKKLLADNGDCANISCLEKIENTDYYQRPGTPNIFNYTNVYLADWKDEYKNADSSVNAAKVLQSFFTLCNVQGDKEFRLDGFKNDDEYGALYSEAIDEEAIKFISQTPEKLGLFYLYIIDGSYSYTISLENVAKICFIKGTNTPACNELESSSSDEIWIDCLVIMNGGCLYGIGNSNEHREAPLVKFINTNGILVNEVQDFKIKIGSYNSRSVKFFGNKFYFIGTDNKLYMLNIDNGETTDIFAKVPEAASEQFMLLTFEAAGSDVYFSAEYGIDVINRVYNADTNKVTNISSNSKFTNILSLIN
ncbi:MAG: hypothetical protein NC041_06800 [Bacteroides sp.]|nr:hypothetical protein [Prevotella sp.]MCM1407005.1 hypothetical protein [Treponema brennaborense]MCM1470156.1 hypothetical protein [Bacteroides sp.]